MTDGGVGQCNFDETFTNSTAFKHAAAFQLNDFAASFNGGAVQTDGAGTMPTVTTLGLGEFGINTQQMNGHIRFGWPTRLPNNMLQQLSA